MKYLFFGTPEFAAIILEKLIKAGFIPAAVVCNPDKPVGRKKIITPPPAKKLLIEKFKDYKINILQPESLKSFNLSIFQSFNLDLFIVAAYSKILPKEILEIPRLGTIGVHPSLLPKYRGPSPIQTAILNGDEVTGVTLYLMDEKLDHGPIISNKKLEIRNENYEALMKKLAELGADLLIDFLRKLNQYFGSQTSKVLKINQFREVGLPEIGIKLQFQNESQATYTKKFTTEDAFIEPLDLEKAKENGGEIAAKIERKIRALNPEPGAYTFINNKRTKLLGAKLLDEKLKITQIQTEGKKPQVL